MKSLISLAMVVVLAMGMVHLAVAQYSGDMNTKLLYGVAKEVRSGVRYGFISAAEGLEGPKPPRSFVASRATRRSAIASKRKGRKNRIRRAHASYARYALR